MSDPPGPKKEEMFQLKYLPPADPKHMAILRERLRQWWQAKAERALLRDDQLH